MSAPEEPRRGREEAAADFARASLALLPVLLLVRVYEFVAVRSAHVLPPGSAGLLARGMASDLVLVLLVAAVLALPVLVLARWAPRAARIVHRIALVVVALAGTGLAGYFAVTFVPLGSDLYGYSLAEIRETALTSGGGGASALVPLVVIGALTWVLAVRARRVAWSRGRTRAFFAAAVAGVLLARPLIPSAEDFGSDAEYFLASNKTVFFARQSAGYLAERWAPDEPQVKLAGYPLLHPARYDDVLGPFLNLPAEPPNVVLVVVEGLGRDFAGPGAHFGGFTPFVDSLAARGLFWDNFISSSGRTFGILPGLLGSLPYGERGFMELGARMPAHLTLVSLLRARGYETGYYTGTNGHFDFIDVFMERQRVDRFMDESAFGPGYTRAPAAEGGFSWGYSDVDLFRRSLEVIGPGGGKPRLDVYLTGTSHEPFRPPREAEYRAEFERRLAGLRVDGARRAEYRKYASVFSTLLFTDDAIASLIHAYERRPEFARTIFVITGDHRLIPVPPRTRLDRYRVPFIIYSPMVKAPRRFSSVSSHLDFAPTLLSLLHRRYGMEFPDRVHWLGTGIDTARAFRNTHAVPLMKTKNTLDEYLKGEYFLSQGQIFQVRGGLEDVRPGGGRAARAELRAELERFRQVNRYVTTRDRLYPGGAESAAERRQMAREDSLFAAQGLGRMNSDQLFALARERAIARRYDEARLIARRMLRESPNLHDVRTLLGRTYAWDRQFAEARGILEEVIRRAPAYADGYSALADVELWDGRAEAALARANAGLAAAPGNVDLRVHRARALEALGRRGEAVRELRGITGSEEAEAVRARLQR